MRQKPEAIHALQLVPGYSEIPNLWLRRCPDHPGAHEYVPQIVGQDGRVFVMQPICSVCRKKITEDISDLNPERGTND